MLLLQAFCTTYHVALELEYNMCKKCKLLSDYIVLIWSEFELLYHSRLTSVIDRLIPEIMVLLYTLQRPMDYKEIAY